MRALNRGLVCVLGALASCDEGSVAEICSAAGPAARELWLNPGGIQPRTDD